MRGSTGSGRRRIKISEKTDLPKQWNGEDWGFYKHLMIAGFEEEDLDAIALGEGDRSTLQTDAGRRWYEMSQIKLKRRILSLLSADLAPRVYGMSTGTEMWTYLLRYFDGRQNSKTKSINMGITFDKLQMQGSRLEQALKGTWFICSTYESTS